MLLWLAGCLLLMERPPKCPDACPGNFRCTEAGECPTRCTGDGQCADGHYCDWIFETCEPACVEGTCPGGYACDGDTGCFTYCYDRAECADGYTCVGDECRERP